MPITTLDAQTALILVDFQRGIRNYPCAHPFAEVLDRGARLAAEFRARHLPVVLVNVVAMAPGRTEQNRGSAPTTFPADFADLLSELEQRPSDIVVTKRTWGAFSHTELEQRLRAAGVTQVVIAGVATSAGVESTARQAHELGLNVTLAVDAMSDSSALAHDNSVMRIFPRLGETGTTQEIIDRLA